MTILRGAVLCAALALPVWGWANPLPSLSPAATTTGFSINLQAAPAASQANTVYGVQFVAVG